MVISTGAFVQGAALGSSGHTKPERSRIRMHGEVRTSASTRCARSGHEIESSCLPACAVFELRAGQVNVSSRSSQCAG